MGVNFWSELTERLKLIGALFPVHSVVRIFHHYKLFTSYKKMEYAQMLNSVSLH